MSIRLNPDAQPEDLERLRALIKESFEGLPVVTGELSADELGEASENAAVQTIRLSRRLRPMGS
ncbi:MAG TPA: hypothetical protein VJ826_16395 [Candidatus Polarisedimenticolaceae bacterium]|nr:hypothetical protein [Candidatus Polarisedimenticolaceae bacterium]